MIGSWLLRRCACEVPCCARSCSKLRGIRTQGSFLQLLCVSHVLNIDSFDAWCVQGVRALLIYDFGVVLFIPLVICLQVVGRVAVAFELSSLLCPKARNHS